MKNLSHLISLDKEFIASLTAMREQLTTKKKPLPIVVNGLFGGAMSVYLAESIREAFAISGAPAIVMTPSEEERTKVYDALCALGVSCLEYKERDFVFNSISASHDIERERLSVLYSMLKGTTRAIITTPKAAMSYTIPASLLLSLTRELHVGEEIRTDELCELLVSLGYARVEVVEAVGQFSQRGDITDVFTGGCEYPVRIEFFGDEIDRMTHFDPITQRSVEPLESATLLPASEVLLDEKARGRVYEELDSLCSSAEDKEIKQSLKRERTAVQNGLSIDFRDRFISLIYEERETLLSSAATLGRVAMFITDTNGVKEAVKRYTDTTLGEKNAIISRGIVKKASAEYCMSSSELDAYLDECFVAHIHPFSGGAESGRALGGLFGFRTRRTVAYGENPAMLHEDIESYRKAGYRLLLLCESSSGARALVRSLADAGFTAVPIYDRDSFSFESAREGEIFVDTHSIEGFELMLPKIAVLSMARDEGRRIMANRRRQRILKRAGGAGERLMSYADLEIGDYVVHANYGIGLFEGIQSVRIDGVTRDYITIKYAGTDKLFVPCDRLELIGKYIGQRDKDGTVKLSKMGGADWNRTKRKPKAAVKDIARALIRRYAERQRLAGFAFPADSELEDEFAADFDYELTDSQAVAIEEIKADMMRPVPMNRLLCGDVGFGKTEVALRAAFKAIMGGKQVAILVPTTILALQHYRTARTRMRNYPVTVEMISRFKTPKEQKRILEATKRGSVDVLIGTHKLLSKQVDFHSLGLLIIDEEQRFGVSQKEKLKELSKNVDVLTLSATPIPRTLNMAMNGISDMSILDEAPGERKPVQTYVLEHSDEVIYDAIRRELARGGQVLYLHNTVEDISFLADRIMRDIPEARCAYAHGQMEKEELEDTWNLLVREEIDVLVCTTIIETGVDLPGANTLIIENADRMGLSQLHQLRGRVGRSSRQAYAYFTYRAGKALSEIATKRLAAIRDYAEFGAGFKVALRDLEIRGAGNLLGREQHGYIDGVGYDLYVKLLSEAVLEEEGKLPESAFESTVDIKVDAHIPERYIKTSSGRMEMYKKISLLQGREDMQEIIDEMSDRYGDIPYETLALLKVALLRSLCAVARVKRVSLEGYVLVLSFDARPNIGVWSEVFATHEGLSFRNAHSTDVCARLTKKDKPIDTAIKILEEYKRAEETEK